MHSSRRLPAGIQAGNSRASVRSDPDSPVGRVGKNPQLDGIVDRQMLLFFQPFKVGPDEFRLIFP